MNGRIEDMKLEVKSRIGDRVECYCELTTNLDELAGLTDKKSSWKHYILVDEFTKKHRCLAIRIPGGTVGSISYNEDRVITNIMIDTTYVVKSYVDNVNEVLQEKYIGVTME